VEVHILTADNLLTVTQLSEKSPAFSEASLRWLIFNKEINGMDSALVKVGRRVLIDIVEFERWLEDQRLGEVRSTPPNDGTR